MKLHKVRGQLAPSFELDGLGARYLENAASGRLVYPVWLGEPGELTNYVIIFDFFSNFDVPLEECVVSLFTVICGSQIVGPTTISFIDEKNALFQFIGYGWHSCSDEESYPDRGGTGAKAQSLSSIVWIWLVEGKPSGK